MGLQDRHGVHGIVERGIPLQREMLHGIPGEGGGRSGSRTAGGETRTGRTRARRVRVLGFHFGIGHAVVDAEGHQGHLGQVRHGAHREPEFGRAEPITAQTPSSWASWVNALTASVALCFMSRTTSSTWPAADAAGCVHLSIRSSAPFSASLPSRAPVELRSAYIPILTGLSPQRARRDAR